MGQLQNRIEKDLHNSILNRNDAKKDILRVIYSDMNKIGRDVTDEQVIKIIKKQIEDSRACHTEEEIPLIEVYLPAEMSDVEMKMNLTIMLSEQCISKTDIPNAMKAAKTFLGSDFDGKRVSAILKTL